MHPVHRQSLVQATAEHLRAGFRSGRWRGHLPGVGRLSDELDVSKDTVRAALLLLETSRNLVAQGPGKRRKILTDRVKPKPRTRQRIGILLPVPLHEDNTHSHRLILGLRNSIEAGGDTCVMVTQSGSPLNGGSFLKQTARIVLETEADAWIIYSNTHEVLKWFSEKLGSVPALALGGNLLDIPMASSRTMLVRAMEQCVDELVHLGHRRIILIAPASWRLPQPNSASKALLERLSSHRITSSEYNLPAWDETAAGLESLLKALFHTTPPTALLFGEPMYCCAARSWLGEHRLRVPADVSLVTILSDPIFQLQLPTYTGFIWPEEVHIHRIQRWLKNIRNGRPDLKEFIAHASFSAGGTIAQARRI